MLNKRITARLVINPRQAEIIMFFFI